MADGTDQVDALAQAEIAAIRVRAAKCRRFADIYVSEVGTSLVELAAELEKQADRLEAKRLRVSMDGKPSEEVSPGRASDLPDP